MTHSKNWVRLARFSLAFSILAAGSAMAEPDRVIRGPVTTLREQQGGIWGNRVTYTDYTYRKMSDQISALFPKGTNLTAFEMEQLAQLLAGRVVTPAQVQAAVNAIQNWKNAAPGKGYDGYYDRYTTGDYSKSAMINTSASKLASALSSALGFPVSSSGPAYNMASRLASDRGWYYDPLVFDLNGDGKINVTGVSTAKIRAPQNEKFVRQGSVLFDILGNGRPARIEWVTSGDGILIDNRNNAARKLVEQGKPLSIVNLFGDSEGNTGGFMKLARTIDSESRIASSGGNVKADGLGIIKGKELDDLLMWVDNGDGKAELKELHTMASLGITEIRLPQRHIHNPDGELIEEATFIRNGKPFKIQEVWFMGEEAGRGK